MIVLAIDTCLGACQVAVLADGEVLAERSEAMTRGHQERLAQMARDVMAAADVAFGALDRIAVTVGPGSFTGLRVGLAFAKGLGVALERPVVGVGTLEALAAAHGGAEGSVAALIDAGRGRLYLQIFQAGGALGEAESLEAAAAMLRLESAAAQCPLTVTGPAALAAEAVAGARCVATAAPPPAVVARLAAAAPTVPVKPLYLRPPDAEPRSTVARSRAILRPARAKDAPALAELHAAAFSGLAGQEAWDADSLAALASAPGALALAAVIDGRPAAFVLARIAADEAEILTLATHPGRRRQGLAKALIEAAAAWATRRGAVALFLEVAEDAAAARALYQGTRFATVGRRPGYYGAGAAAKDALVLRRPLSPQGPAIETKHTPGEAQTAGGALNR